MEKHLNTFTHFSTLKLLVFAYSGRRRDPQDAFMKRIYQLKSKFYCLCFWDCRFEQVFGVFNVLWISRFIDCCVMWKICYLM